MSMKVIIGIVLVAIVAIIIGLVVLLQKQPESANISYSSNIQHFPYLRHNSDKY